MSRFASFFLTQHGRYFTRFCVGTAALTLFGNQIAVNGPLLDRVKNVFQAYKHGKPRPLAPKVNGLIEEVLHDSNLKEKQKENLKFFYVVGHDVTHFGGINSPWGAIIGIPFLFEDIKDINFRELRIVGKDIVDWIIDGQDLVEAVTLSDNAKKFALMREIYSCQLTDVITNGVIGAGCVILPARVAQMLNSRTDALERLTLRQRSVRYLLLYAAGYLFYRLLKDPLKHVSEKKADQLAAETGIDYLNGGIEFYKKKLMKQKALREISVSRFKGVYDEHGNENYFIFAPKLPTSKRLEYLQDMRKEKMGKVDESSK